MKKIIFTLIVFVSLHLNSYSQDPLLLKFLLNASIDSYKEFWNETGFVFYDYDADEYIIAYENPTSTVTYFVDFSPEWKNVDKVTILYRNAQVYYSYFGYCKDHYLKINEDEGDIFMTIDWKEKITFFADDQFYSVIMEPIKK